MSQLDFLTRADRYTQAIAQSTPRKLALLVGVNNYPADIPNLRGCENDVALQCELLTHRFGFDPANIVKISDSEALKPTRETVINAFQEHLVKQAKPGDVVVFHYSGHGLQVRDPLYLESEDSAGSELDEMNGAIVLNDPLPVEGAENANRLSVIMGGTLFLLMRSLQTNNVTAILDSCYSGGGLRGNAVVRSVPPVIRENTNVWEAIPAELALQKQLMEAAGLSLESLIAERKAGIARGLGIGSTQFSELALDSPFDSFHAGAFTYLLTRYLWQMPGSATTQAVQTTLKRSTQAAAAAVHHTQVPSFQTAPNTDTLSQPIYFTAPVTGPAEAVITNVTGDQVEFWAGGISTQSLALNDRTSRFTVLDSNRDSVAEIEQVSRVGLVGSGKFISQSTALVPGMLMRETLMGLSSNPQLKVGVDASFGADIDSMVEALSTALVWGERYQLEVGRVDQQQDFDYLIGRVTQEYADKFAAGSETALPPVGTISLFTVSLEPVLASYGRVDEPVSSAVNRLKARLKLLLANKVLKALTSISSGIAVSGEIFAEGNSSSLVPITGSERGFNPDVEIDVTPFKSGENIQIRVVNKMKNDAIYLSCLVINQTGNMKVIHPARWDTPEDAALISPNSEITIPNGADMFTVNGTGFLEIVTITSTSSLRDVLRGLQEIASNRGILRGYVPLDGGESLGVLGDLLGDFNRISRGRSVTETGTARVEEETIVDGRVISLSSTVIEVAEAL